LKRAFWKQDWVPGLLLSLFFIAFAQSDLLQSLERKVYDIGVQLSQRTPSDRIAVIAIDDTSIANLGRWPWSRDLHARMIDLLAAAGVKSIGYAVFFSEPQADPGLARIRSIREFYQGSSLAAGANADAVALGTMLDDAATALDADSHLHDALARSGNVLLPLAATLGEAQGNPDPLPDYLAASQLTRIGSGGVVSGDALPLPASQLLLPVPELGAAAAAVGHLNLNPDVDGGARTLPLVLRYHDKFIPSLAVMLAAHSLNLTAADVEIDFGRGLGIGKLFVPTDAALQMRPMFYAGEGAAAPFAVDSFYDVLSGKIAPSKYRDKIVLVGATATGVGNTQVTPVSPAMAPVTSFAHIVSSILNQDFIATPGWGHWVELGAVALVVLYLVLLLPRLGAAAAATITLLLLATLVAGHLVAMTQYAIWLQLMLPAALLLTGHLLLTTKRFLVTERGKVMADASSAESNRMLGLAFQNQGQLDMALEKFRKVPLDASMMEVFYNLGLDFERKRQFAKAAATFEYAARFDPGFRDLKQRIQRNHNLGETVMLGGTGAARTGTLVLDKEGVQKPRLGRYEVQRELGKGAMGVVYEGRDPQINRTVAIKTLALSQEFEEQELAEVKSRFFREAETAGRLSHPNIVTIYDAGEDQDLAYIAMELLHGNNLTAYTRPGALLPPEEAARITLTVANALHYAHDRQVVHRDIKPANIMYDPQSRQIKVTDFGIARITDSSRTKTGVILGTPSYMSPEQLVGRKVDGRSDLFSLGATFYQLLTGELPFTGDSIATLTYRIANEAPVPLLERRPDLPRCLGDVVSRCLEKSLETRYQSAAEFAEDLAKCMK